MTFRRALTRFKNSLLKEFDWDLTDQEAIDMLMDYFRVTKQFKETEMETISKHLQGLVK